MKLTSILISFLFVVPAIFGWYSFLFGLSKPQEINLAIALLAFWFWVTEAIPLYTTALLVLFLELVWLVPAWGPNAPKPIVFYSCFFSETILLFLGGFVFATVIQKYGLDRSLGVFALRYANGSAFRLVLFLGFLTGFLSFWMNNTATAAMVLGLVSSLLAKLSKINPLRKALLFMIPFSANLGGIATPIGTLPNAIGMATLQSKGIYIPFLKWILIATPIALLSIFALAWFLKSKDLDQVNLDNSGLFEKTSDQVTVPIPVVAILFGTVFLWVSSDLHGISPGMIALLPVILCFGFGYLESSEFKRLSWDVLILMGGGIALGKAFEETGLAKHIVYLFQLEQFSTYGLLVFFSALAICLSSFLSNTSVANLLLPITIGLSDGSVLPAALGATIGASLAMPLPISTPPNALAFGYGGIRSWEMVKVGGFVTVLSWVLFLLWIFLLEKTFGWTYFF